MLDLPRLAVVTAKPDASPEVMSWALSEAFRRVGVRVQRFLSRANFSSLPGSAWGGGESPRHLDSWLMTPEACRALFVYGSRTADLALVQGSLAGSEEDGGQVGPLCEWLDLPRLLVLDVSRLEQCRLPDVPRNGDIVGLLLEGIRDVKDGARVATNLEALLRIPVVGALETMPELRGTLSRLSGGERVSCGLLRQLGDRLMRWWRPEKILQLASRRPLPSPTPSWLPGGLPGQCKLTVGIAYDDAFHCYFPDTFDLLELQGASVIDFSPLRDEHLPPQADVLVFGCGCPDRYARLLSENHCMIAAIRSHVCAGRRIYAEGGGVAYLCREIEVTPGESRRMAGILPAVARRLREPLPTLPAEVRLARPAWLGPTGTVLRGYTIPQWQFLSLGANPAAGSDPSLDGQVLGDFQVVGSPLHLHVAANPCYFRHLFLPERNHAGNPNRFAIRLR